MPRSKNKETAAVLFADIVGYTASMQSNEEQALALLQQFKIKLETRVAANHGEIIHFYGDGCLCVFAQGLDAVACAKNLQADFQTIPKIPVRIGIHAGEVVFREGNVFGHTVNVASRIESMGVAGSVLLSNEVHQQIKEQTTDVFKSLGSFEFKNVAEGIMVFALATEGLIIPERKELVGKFKTVAKKNNRWASLLGGGFLVALLMSAFWYFLQNEGLTITSEELNLKEIAIFPFEVKGSPNIQYLREGIVDLLSNKLNNIPDINAVDPNRIYHQLEPGKRLSTTTAAQLAKEFKATKFILGSIIELNDNIEITASKYDQNGVRIEEKNVSGLKTELASLIDELTRTLITSELSNSGRELKSLAVTMTASIPALQAFLEGEQAFRRADPDKASELFVKATELDETFALAWLRLKEASIWSPRNSNPEAITQMLKYKDKLPQKYQDLLRAEVMFYDTSPNTGTFYQQLITKYGESRELTNGLAEFLFHHNPIFGKSSLEAKPWLLKTKQLDPNNQEANIHLMHLALAEGDAETTQMLLEETDSSAAYWQACKAQSLLFQEEISDESIKALANHPNFRDYLYTIFMAAPEDPTNLFRFIERICKEKEDSRLLNNLYRQFHLFGKEVLAYEYTKKVIAAPPLYNHDFTSYHYTVPATFIASKSFRPLAEYYNNLYEELEDRQEPWALFAKSLYALALDKKMEYVATKKEISEQMKEERLVKPSKYFLYSLNAVEARKNGLDDECLIWIDSAFQYAPSFYEAGSFCMDKIVMKSEILEERCNFKASIALLENIPVADAYSYSKGFTTYSLGRLYEKDGQDDKAIAKSNLLIKMFADCDEKYKTWVAEAEERRDRLMKQ